MSGEGGNTQWGGQQQNSQYGGSYSNGQPSPEATGRYSPYGGGLMMLLQQLYGNGNPSGPQGSVPPMGTNQSGNTGIAPPGMASTGFNPPSRSAFSLPPSQFKGGPQWGQPPPGQTATIQPYQPYQSYQPYQPYQPWRFYGGPQWGQIPPTSNQQGGDTPPILPPMSPPPGG